MALYHTHRPQLFESVIGQEHITKTIRNQIAAGKHAHAYLFSGPRGVGKTTTARIIAKAVNCTERKEGTAEPCDKCKSCEAIQSGSNMDVMEIDAASHTGVDNVREAIIDNARISPSSSKNKVFIIDEVHMLSTSAFNALLKTLEEPPKNVIFILATTELHKLPATIISRCQRFQFQSVSPEVMKAHLKAVAKEEKVKVDEDVLSKIASKSDGCVRDAVSLLEQAFATGEKHITSKEVELFLPVALSEHSVNFVSQTLSGNSAEAYALIEKMISEGVNSSAAVEEILEMSHALLRAVLTNSYQHAESLYSKSIVEGLKEIASANSKQTLVKFIDRLVYRMGQMGKTSLAWLPMELLVAEFSGGESSEQVSSGGKPAPTPVAPSEPVKSSGGSSAPAVKTEMKEKSPKEEVVNETVQEAHVPVQPAEVRTEEPVSTTSKNLDWNTLKSKILEGSPSLGIILNETTCKEFSGSSLVLSVPYSFHKDKLTENASKQMIQELVEKEFGASVSLSVETGEADKSAPAPVNNDLQDLASSFGGQVMPA